MVSWNSQIRKVIQMNSDSKFMQVAAAASLGIGVLFGGPVVAATAIGLLAYRTFTRETEPKKSN